MRYVFFLALFVLFSSIFSAGQCPDRDVLWKRLVFLRDASTLSPAEKLNTLLSYESQMKDCPYKFDSTHALLLQRIGATYFAMADYLKATDYTKQAINIINSNAGKPSVNIKHNIKNYYNLGWFSDSLGNVSEKMAAFDSCIAVAMRLNSPDLYCVVSLTHKAEHLFDVGDYQSCINYSKLLERVSQQYAEREDKDRGSRYVLTSLSLRVNALIKFKDYEAAEKILYDKIDECKKAGLEGYLNTIYQQLADVEIKKKNYEKAILYYGLAFKYANDVRDSLSCVIILNNTGYDIFFKNLNQPDKAITYCRQALTYNRNKQTGAILSRFEALNALNNLGSLYASKGLYDSASTYFKDALDQIKPGMTEEALLNSSLEDFSKQKNMHYLSDLLLNKGDALLQQYRHSGKNELLNEGIKVYKIADQLLDKIKYQQTELQSKLLWRSDSRRLYERAIDACYLQNNPAEAFYFFEKSRAVLLQDQLNEQHWAHENDIHRQAQLEKQIRQLQEELNGTDKSSSHYSGIQDEIFANGQELERLGDLIKTNNPLYYQNFVEKDFITIKDVHGKILKDHQALVELFAGDSAVYVLVITSQRSYLKKIDKNSFDRLSDGYKNFISNPDLLNRSFSQFKDLSGELYQLIFKGINLPAGRIIFSPDGKYFPFEALVTNSQPLTYFLEDHAVSYAYSARYLLNNFNVNPTLNSYTFIGFAPVQYASALPELPGSDQSLQRVGGYFTNATNFIKGNASKNNFLNEYHKYKIIQLYTHATDSGYAGEPVIYFSDSVLSLSDLFYEGKPSTSLVVLSACETAKGKLYNGEGVFSFSRQFAALGIPSSVSNLWKVDNQATYKLTELFYKYLSRGLPSDVALQKAKKEFRGHGSSKDKDLPYYWAAPVLIGQSNAILSEKPFQWQWLVLSIVALSVLLLIWIKRFRKSSKRLSS
jgi:CHAT domain-containing protein